MPWSVFVICSNVEELKVKGSLWFWFFGFTQLQVFVQNAERLLPVPHVKLGSMSYFKWLLFRHSVYQQQSLYVQLEEIPLSSGSATNSLTCELLVILLWCRRNLVLNSDFYTYPCFQKERRAVWLSSSVWCHLPLIFPSQSPMCPSFLGCFLSHIHCIVNCSARVGLGVGDHFSWQ